MTKPRGWVLRVLSGAIAIHRGCAIQGQFAVSLAEAGIPTFLLDYTRNPQAVAHPGITRVSGWRDVLAELM